MFQKIRHDLLLELRFVQPVAFVEDTHQGFPGEIGDKTRQKIDMVPSFGIFSVKHADEHIGSGDGLFDDRYMLAKRPAVGIRGVHQKHVLEAHSRRIGSCLHNFAVELIDQLIAIARIGAEND